MLLPRLSSQKQICNNNGSIVSDIGKGRRSRNWQGCWDSAIKVETLTKEKHYLINDDVWNWKCFDLLAISGWHLGKKKEAIDYAVMAIQNNPKEQRLIDNLEWMQKQDDNV